jgi:hypothetical protein
MGIGINSSWKVEVLRQLYMANLPNNTIITSDQEEEINVVQNTPENVQVTNVPITFEILERVSVADRNAHVVSLNRASLFTFCTSVVLHVFIRDSLPNEENPSAAAEFTTGRAVYSEDLPKMDFVTPPVKKQILEGKEVNLTIL